MPGLALTKSLADERYQIYQHKYIDNYNVTQGSWLDGWLAGEVVASRLGCLRGKYKKSSIPSLR